MRSHSGGSLPNKRQKNFPLDGLNQGSKFFSFSNVKKRTMSDFQFNPEERNFPIYGAAERSYPVKDPIDYSLWVLELIYVYSIGKETILNEEVDQKVFRTAYRQWVAAKEEQVLISFHEAGFFRELLWKPVKHDKMNDKPVDGWFQFDYVLDLTKGTENQYIIIG